MNREYYELGLPIIEKAGVAHKIDFREGPALPLLDELLKDVRAPYITILIHTFHYRTIYGRLKLKVKSSCNYLKKII